MTENKEGVLSEYKVKPYRNFPNSIGSKHIDKMETKPMKQFWYMLAKYSPLDISLTKT